MPHPSDTVTVARWKYEFMQRLLSHFAQRTGVEVVSHQQFLQDAQQSLAEIEVTSEGIYIITDKDASIH